jgi:predicted nucleic acid-binding protein
MAQSEVVLALDAGALIAAGKGRRIDALVKIWLDKGASVIIPVPAIAEAIRGRSSDAAANRLIKAANVAETTEAIARDAGARLAAAKSSGTLDALIVATAEANFATDILTTDPDDLRALASANLNVIAL